MRSTLYRETPTTAARTHRVDHILPRAQWIDWAPLPLRLILGLSFIYHGIPKFTDAGHAGFVGMLAGIGVPQAEVAAWLLGGLEIVGGAALLAGAYVTVISALLAIEMIVAGFTVHLPAGLNWMNVEMSDAGPVFGMPGIEISFLYIAGLLALGIGGAGFLSVDWALAKRKWTK